MTGSTEAPKRKPGRPRKSETAARSTSKDAAPKRGPGRPRKSETAATAPVKRGPGRPRKSQSAVAAAAPVKRGPGRPRKAEGVAPPRRGPGRPPSSASAPASSSAAPRRGPGRPRKNDSAPAARPPQAAPSTARTQPETHDVATWMGDIGRHGLALVRALMGHAHPTASLTSGDIFSTREVADLVGVRESEVMHAIERGELKATRIGSKYRVTRHNVAGWLHQ